MSNLKDTDTDDLFRRASDKYPLRTDSSDWDRMAAALEKDPPPPGDGTDTTDRRKKRRFFWLFFLLPLGVGGLGYYVWHSGAGTKAGSTAAATTAKASVATNTAAGANSTDATNIPDATQGSAPTNTAGSTLTPTAAAGAPAANPTAASSITTPPAQVATGGAHSTVHSAGVANRGDRSLLADAGRQTNADRKGNSGHQPKDVRFPEPDLAGADVHLSTNAATAGSPFSTSLTQNRQDRLFYDLQREPVDRNYQLRVNVVAPAVKKDSTTTKQKKSPKTKTSYLYAGILVAPDLSTVKMQAVKGVGNTFGALVGFAFNSHWAIETGAYLDRKKYYTEGQYFNTKEIAWPTTDTLKSVNGTCYMWEIPLNLRYTFNPGAKTRWFATAGFTTYLMTSEKYTYDYEWSGWTGTSTGNIKKPSQYPFSIVNLSAGFEQRLGKVGNLRVEPYLRIPLTGMGTGKLPIMSTGINIGITRQLWKK